MQPKVMITNGGDHPADKWAKITAEMIGDLIQVDENSTSSAAISARKALPHFVLDLADALEDHHALAAVAFPLAEDVTPVDKALIEFSTIVAKTPFAYWGANPTTLAVVRGIIGSHMATVQHSAHSWQLDTMRG